MIYVFNKKGLGGYPTQKQIYEGIIQEIEYRLKVEYKDKN